MKTTAERRLEFEYLISSAELDIHQNPRAYQIKVALFALLGYAVILGMLALLLAMIGGIAWVAMAGKAVLLMLLAKKIIFVIPVMIFIIVKALWVTFDPPKGYELKAKEYPALFKELKYLTKKLATPPIHQVILTPEYNAGILQTPRLGIFGWYKNTLFLGLELLMSMTPEQARSVIAHELGHLSGKHSRFSGWIYRIRLSWQRIMDGLDVDDNMGVNLMRWFFDWYAPKFAAYSFALARANEYEADKIAAKLTSRQVTAEALVNSHIVHDYLSENYWRPFFKNADETPQPAVSPYRELQVFLQTSQFDPEIMKNEIRRAMAVKTGHVDTHPALRDRLEALHSEPAPPEPISLSAAAAWFKTRLTNVIKDFDKEWYKNNAPKWQERYRYVSQARSKLQMLNAKDVKQLNTDELWQLAALTEEFQPAVDCLPLYQLFRARQPDNADADFAVGRLLLTRNDENGVDVMKQVLEKNSYLKLNACEWLVHFYKQRNDAATAKSWQKQADRQMDINAAADRERQLITAEDHFIKPARPSDTEKFFTQQIKKIKGVSHAWLAEKRMQHYPDWKTYIVIVEKGLLDQEAKLVKQITANLGNQHHFFVLVKGGAHDAIVNKAMSQCLTLF